MSKDLKRRGILILSFACIVRLAFSHHDYCCYLLYRLTLAILEGCCLILIGRKVFILAKSSQFVLCNCPRKIGGGTRK